MIDHKSESGTIYKQITIYSDTKLELVFILNQVLASSI